MDNRIFSVKVPPKPRRVHWEPKEDITTYELARAIEVMLIAVGGGWALAAAEQHLANLPPAVSRHFRLEDVDG